MIKIGIYEYSDEEALRKAVAAYTLSELTDSEVGWSSSTVLSYKPSIVRARIGAPWEKLKKDVVEQWVTYLLAQNEYVKPPETFEELRDAVIREVMDYEGCWSGKQEWLNKIGLNAPPPSLIVEIEVAFSEDALAEADRESYSAVLAALQANVSDKLTVTDVRSVYQD